VKWEKTALISVFIIVFSVLAGYSGCKDIVFNNPLDPNASKDVVSVIRVIETPLAGRGDIAFDGEKIWKIGISGNLTAVDRESGAVIRSFAVVPGTGVGFFMDSIYLCGGEGQGENILVVVDPLSGDILNRVSTGDIYPGFLAAYHDRLILFDVRSAGIFEYDPGTGNATRLFEISGLNIGGIAVYRGGLLISDMNTDSIYRFSLSGSAADVYTSPAAGIGGLTVDNSDYVYLCMLDGKIYKVSLP
jgi:outer membrane protein assembly factor BamB